MKEKDERRSWKRDVHHEPGLGVIRRGRENDTGNDDHPWDDELFFVGVHNQCPGGLLIDTASSLAGQQRIELSSLDFATNSWQHHYYTVAWEEEKKSAQYLIGLKIDNSRDAAAMSDAIADERNLLLADIEFLLETSLLDSIPRRAIWPLLNCLQPVNMAAGEQVITQGDPGISLYLIQEGECVVKVEKEGEMLPVARLGRSDVVGEMAVLTGEPRYANVFANKDIKLWRLSKDQFEAVSAVYPDLRMFLTELVSKRLETSAYTSDREIGKYRINRKLGQGAWGIIYHGIHTALNKTVAVKMLKHTMAMDEVFYQRFKQEATIIAQLNHRNIVHVYDIEELYQTLFIVMEFLEGETLEDILARQITIAFPLAVNYLMQTCSGLAYAHAQGIVHQDIKPANLYMLSGDIVKILDFGLACDIDIGSKNFDMEGTAFYMAPEQINSGPVDERTDVYCLGITAYEMVTGQRPYPEDDLAALLDMHVDQDIPDPRLLVPDLPEELHRFIRKACNRDPACRYQNMDEAMAELQPYYQQHVLAGQDESHEKQRMTTLFFLYRDEHVGVLNELFEEVSNRARDLGVEMRAAEFKNL